MRALTNWSVKFSKAITALFLYLTVLFKDTTIVHIIYQSIAKHSELKSKNTHLMRFERMTFSFGGWHSIQLSYRCKSLSIIHIFIKKSQKQLHLTFYLIAVDYQARPSRFFRSDSRALRRISVSSGKNSGKLKPMIIPKTRPVSGMPSLLTTR